MNACFWRRETLPLDSYRDLVELLHANLSSVVVNGILQTALAAVIASRLTDVIAMELVFVIVATAVARLAVALIARSQRSQFDQRPVLTAWEERHAVAYWSNALALGALGAKAAFSGDATAAFIFAVVLVNFASELIAKASGRPFICTYALAAAFLPATLVLLVTLDGERVWQAGTLVASLATATEILRFNHRALTVRMQAARSFARLANADPLTGLPNRLAFCAFLDRSLAARAPDEIVAVHCLDLDRFKEANDRFGHAVGDDLLKAFASRLRMSLSPGDLVARLGGDEFVLVQCGITRPDQARQLAESIIRRAGEPFDLGGTVVDIGVSVGIALAPEEGDTAQRLLAQADAALYSIKRRGRNGFALAVGRDANGQAEIAAAA